LLLLDDTARLVTEREHLLAAGKDVEHGPPPMAPMVVYVQSAE
jgi:hypothetical protein